MALIGKPTVKSTTAFDIVSTLDSSYTIEFTWNGQRCNGNRLIIIETGKSHDITGLSSTYHELTTDVCNSLGLVNGNTYHATVTMLDFEGNAVSNSSDQFLIYCYAAPDFSIRSITDNSTIKSTEFMAMLNYYSNEMDISSYKFNLYDATGTTLLDSSNELYELPNENTTDYSSCSYTFKGLENNTSYYIEAKGVTVYGMELKCSYYFTVKANTPSGYSVVSTDATRDGNINVGINCIPMGYDSNHVSYINNDEADLRNNNSFVKYTLIKPLENFKFKAKLRGIKDFHNPIISFSDSTKKDSTIISIVPNIQYIHGTILAEDATMDELIRPVPFIYTDDGINKEYIDYIEQAYLLLNLYDNNKQYTVNSVPLILEYNKDNDKFYLDENRNIIVEIIKNNGNYKLNVTEIKEDGNG